MCYSLQTKEELRRVKAEYEALNAQLLDDLPRLFVLSVDILYDVVHLFLRLQYGFYAHAANQVSTRPLVIATSFLTLLHSYSSAYVCWPGVFAPVPAEQVKV